MKPACLALAAPSAFAVLSAFAAPAVPARAQTVPAAPVTAPETRTADAKPAVSLADGYVLGVGDTLEVSVIGQADYAARIQVQADGTIQLPYINSIVARDRTVLQLRDEIAQKLKDGGYYRDPKVNIAIVSYASRYVVVLGQVGNPGIVPVDRAYRLSELLARVGGARETGADLVTVRRASGEELQLPIERVAIGSGDDDPIINPGDKLYIGPAPTFYIYGQVRAAGTFRIQPGMTLRQALAQGGGLNERGSEKRIKLFRGGKQLPEVDLSTAIKPGDVIVVGERFF